MGNSNEMTIIFDSRPENEGLARVAAAAFCTQLNPTLEEVADLKTAVSEAVTNCIIHGYQGEVHKIRMKCVRKERTIYLDIEDDGIGIADVEKAMEPLYTTRADSGQVQEWGLLLWKHLWMRLKSPHRLEKEPVCI